MWHDLGLTLRDISAGDNRRDLAFARRGVKAAFFRESPVFYKTKREAQTAADILRTRATDYGHQANVLSPARNLVAAEAFSLVAGGPDVALLELIQAGLAHEQKREASVPGQH